jgi:hypothetical protein
MTINAYLYGIRGIRFFAVILSNNFKPHFRHTLLCILVRTARREELMKCEHCNSELSVTQIVINKGNVEFMTTCDECWDNQFFELVKGEHCEVVCAYTRSAKKENIQERCIDNNVVSIRKDE